MKALTPIIALLATVTLYSQPSTFDHTEFSNEFVRLLDSIRQALNGDRFETEFSKEHRGFVDYPLPYETSIDSVANEACKHHNRFLHCIVKNTPNQFVVGHLEDSVILDEFIYTGNEPILPTFLDRVEYYSTEEHYFDAHGECIHGGFIPESWDNMNSKEIARYVFDKFMASKDGHREILINPGYTSIGISAIFEKGRIYITVLTGVN